jgi:hypothetical protein
MVVGGKTTKTAEQEQQQQHDMQMNGNLVHVNGNIIVRTRK